MYVFIRVYVCLLSGRCGSVCIGTDMQSHQQEKNKGERKSHKGYKLYTAR